MKLLSSLAVNYNHTKPPLVPSLVNEQQLQSLISSQLHQAASEAKAKAVQKKDV